MIACPLAIDFPSVCLPDQPSGAGQDSSPAARGRTGYGRVSGFNCLSRPRLARPCEPCHSGRTAIAKTAGLAGSAAWHDAGCPVMGRCDRPQQATRRLRPIGMWRKSSTRGTDVHPHRDAQDTKSAPCACAPKRNASTPIDTTINSP